MLQVQSQPIVQMILNNLLQPRTPDTEMRFGVAHQALSQVGAAIAIRYRIPTIGYVPPATRLQPMLLPVLPCPPSYNKNSSVKTWDHIRTEIETCTPPIFGSPFY
jgi:hypothetical protein